nr:DUF362 domain-containing protein [Anaerocolumna cellulosilytica]
MNLVGPHKPEAAATTHPEVVSLIVDILISLECEVMLCEDIDGISILEETKILPILKKYGLSFYNLREYGYKSIEAFGETYQYSELIDTCDVFIEIPKFKTHMLTHYTGAIKNLYGCIKRKQRKDLHKNIDEDDFAKIICSVYSIRKPDIVIMDAITAMEGWGPSLGQPKYLGKLVLSTDGVLVDYYLVLTAGFKPEQLKTLQNAIKRHLSEFASEEDIFQYCSPYVKEEKFNRLPVYFGRQREKYIEILRRSLHINQDECIHCGKCKDACPFNAIDMESNMYQCNSEKCNLCTCCLELCPVGAIRLRL